MKIKYVRHLSFPPTLVRAAQALGSSGNCRGGKRSSIKLTNQKLTLGPALCAVKIRMEAGLVREDNGSVTVAILSGSRAERGTRVRRGRGWVGLVSSS